MDQQSQKRKYHILTIAQKIEFCRAKDANPHLSNVELAQSVWHWRIDSTRHTETEGLTTQ
jgi:hypothetical protein